MGNAVDWVKEQTVIGDVDDWVNDQTVMGDVNDWLDDQGMEWLWYAVPLAVASVFAPQLIPGWLDAAAAYAAKVPVLGKSLAAPFKLASGVLKALGEGVGMAKNALGFGTETAAVTGLEAEAAALSSIGTESFASKGLEVGGGPLSEAAAEAELANISMTPAISADAAGSLAADTASAGGYLDSMADGLDNLFEEMVSDETIWETAENALYSGLSGIVPGLVQYAGQMAIEKAMTPDTRTTTTTSKTEFPAGSKVPQISLAEYNAPRRTPNAQGGGTSQATAQPALGGLDSTAPAEGSGLLASSAGTPAQRAARMDRNTTQYAKAKKPATKKEMLSNSMSKALAKLNKIYNNNIPPEQMTAIAENLAKAARQLRVEV